MDAIRVEKGENMPDCWRVRAVTLDRTYPLPRFVFVLRKEDGPVKVREVLRTFAQASEFVQLVNLWVSEDQVDVDLWCNGWSIYPKKGVKRVKTLRLC